MKQLLIFFFLFTAFLSNAQTRVIMGRVTDSDNQPIIDVNICSLADTSYTVYSDVGGFYSFVLQDTVTTLRFSKKGFISKVARLNETNELNVTLEISTVYEMAFEDLLQTKVSTVSLKEQNIKEAPGIVTVFTKNDLRQMGARTVREALTYVAGFSPMQNDDEQIFAVRGIFATTNQKILVMRDGHSLNEANLDLPQTDYSLSIENIEKIEIIRGPGASIYGNSALAAVVNIITTTDNGTKVKIGAGNYGQFSIDGYTAIKLKDNSSILTYGRYSSVQGQPYNEQLQNYPDAPGYKGTYKTFNYPMNYDIGFIYRSPYFTSSLSVRKHLYKTYWTANGTYTNIDSLLAKPRLLQNSLHYDLVFKPVIKPNLKLILQNYSDYCQLNNYRLLSPIDSVRYHNGRLQLNEWNVIKIGANYYLSWAASERMQAILGVAFEHRQYLESWLADNTNDPTQIVFKNKPFIPEGNENKAAIFAQSQISITSWLKADAGFRFDYAERYKSSLNPRIAFIGYLQNQTIIKAIYTSAFQAPGYSYRTSNADYSGSITDLQPERLITYQISVRQEFIKNAFVEVAAYYNTLNNLITRINNNYYANYGKVSNYGIEAESRVNFKNLSIFANYAILLPDSAKSDSIFRIRNIRDNKFRHFPEHTVNIGFNYHPVKNWDWSVYGQYYSGFYAQQNIMVKQRFIINSTLNLNVISEFLNLSLSIYNLTNEHYKLGDPSVSPIPQPGRWYMLSATFKLNKTY